MSNPAEFRAMIEADSDTELVVRCLQLMRLEAAHGEQCQLDPVRHLMTERGLEAEYERCRQHVKQERAKGRGHIIPFEAREQT